MIYIKKPEERVRKIKRKMANKYIPPGVYTRDIWIPVSKYNTLDRKIKINKIFDLKLDIYDISNLNSSYKKVYKIPVSKISESKLNSIIKSFSKLIFS
jgi:hypothetical protein